MHKCTNEQMHKCTNAHCNSVGSQRERKKYSILRRTCCGKGGSLSHVSAHLSKDQYWKSQAFVQFKGTGPGETPCAWQVSAHALCHRSPVHKYSYSVSLVAVSTPTAIFTTLFCWAYVTACGRSAVPNKRSAHHNKG